MTKDIYLVVGLTVVFLVLSVLVNYVNRATKRKLMRTQLEERRNYLAGLQVGDEVILTSGFHGKIMAITDNRLTLKIAESVTVCVEKEAVLGKTEIQLFKT